MSSQASSTYDGGGGYGGGGGGGGGGELSIPSSGYGGAYAEYLEELQREPEDADIALAWFLFLFCSGFVVAAMVSLVLFFRARNVFQIRARSSYLVLLAAASIVSTLVVLAVTQTYVLFDYVQNSLATHMTLYFAVVCSNCCYGSRAIRLAVLYSPRFRKLMPWLTSERNHLCACVAVGLAFWSFLLYDKVTMNDGPFAELVFAKVAADRLWRITIGCQCTLTGVYPLVRKVDDIFNIGPELRVIIFLQLIVTLGGRFGQDSSNPEVSRYINLRTMGVFSVSILYAFSVMYPVWQLVFHPLQSSDPRVSRALARRRKTGMKVGVAAGSSASTASGSFPPDESKTSESAHSAHGSAWTYERVAAIPEVADAFLEYSRKALCQESVLFLKDAARFQDQSPQDAKAGEDTIEEQFSMFRLLIRMYVADGAPDEINISSADKRKIIDVHQAGKLGFSQLSDNERRYIFASAYAEVRFMLESNLMARFIATDEFKDALALSAEGIA